MVKAEKLNMNLRTKVLSHSLQQEQTSSDILKSLLRILKPMTKTLSNKTSSLSFRNKIDLLYDLEEFSSEEYNGLIKFMEIRNQFIHNSECNSFIKLDEINSDLTNYLKNNFPNNESDKEKSLYNSYDELYVKCQGKLLILEKEYSFGKQLDYERYINSEIVCGFEEILNIAKHNYKESNAKVPIPLVFFNPEEEIESFINFINLSKTEFALKIIDKIDSDDKQKEVFKRKMKFEDIKIRLRKEKENL